MRRTKGRAAFLTEHGVVCIHDAVKLGPWRVVAYSEIKAGDVIRLAPHESGICSCCGEINPDAHEPVLVRLVRSDGSREGVFVRDLRR